MIPRKQRSTQADWLGAVRANYTSPDRARAAELLTRAVERVRAAVPARSRAAYAWSGGKDSQALRLVAEAAGVRDAVLIITDLEYPAFLAWCTDNMPWGLTVQRRPLGLAWLAAHPELLFPQDAATASRWFATVQGTGTRGYCAHAGVETLLLGRRLADGNVVGPGGRYRDRAGFWRLSPLFDWSHEDLLCVLGANRMALPPCYSWPRGFRVGTGPWPARQWTASPADGWREVALIDPGIVAHAARAFPEARAALKEVG